MAMASNSKAFEECPPQPLSGSLSIRAPLTLYDSDSEFDASLSDTAFDSDASATARPLVADELSAMHAATLRVTPFAHLSTYDDDDRESDDELLTVVRVPQHFVAAPRINVLDEEENAEPSMFMNYLPVSQSLLDDDLAFFNDMSSHNFIEAEDDISSVRIYREVVVEEHGLDDRVCYDEYSIATDTDVMSQYSQGNLNNERFGKVRVVLSESENYMNTNEGITIKLIENDSTMQGKLEVDTGEATDMVEGSSTMVGDTSLLLLKSSVEDYEDSRMRTQNTGSVNDLVEHNSQLLADFSMTDEPVSDAFAENVQYSTTQSTLANATQGFAFDQESECITKSVINSKAKLHDSSASFESSDDACEGKQIQNVESSDLLDPTLLQETTYLENDLSENMLGVSEQDDLFCNNNLHEYMETGLNLEEDNVKKEATADLNTVSQESKRDGSNSDVDAEGMMSVSLEQFKEQISALSILLGSMGSGKNCQQEQSVMSSHENMILPRDDAKGQSIPVASGGESNGSTVTITSADESGVIFLQDTASFSCLPHCEAQAGFKHHISDNEKEKIQKIQDISVKFLRLVQRVNLSLEDSLVLKVLCRLVADIGRRSNQEFVIKSAKISAKKLEEDCEDDLDFSLNILVLGKSGVGKSATINSIFGDMKVMTNAFEPATTSVKEISGTIGGVKIRILDTPGLRTPIKEQAFNRKILSCLKRYIKKFPLDVILYVDRVDAQTRDLNDLPILRSITSSLSPSIWQRAILTLTHAASTPLDGPSGSPLSYEVSVAQKSYLVQQSIRQAIGDLCQLSPSFMCSVSLVENHPLCGKNISGECVLPNGLRWRSQLLASCFSLKILSEVSSMSRPLTLFDHWKHLFFQNKSPPLSHPLSSLLQSPAHLKFSADWN